MKKCYISYADDASLLVLEKPAMQINDEFDKVAARASETRLEISMDKMKEIVFHRPHPKNLLLPTTLPGIERVLSAKLLGVCLQSDLGWTYMWILLLKKNLNNDYIYQLNWKNKACLKAF